MNDEWNKNEEIEKEAEFYYHEIFISKTDKKGIIRFGNPTFFRISEYSSDDLLGRPHNQIRHPDMPAAVFKLLWDEIKQDRMLVAYVKNRTKNGKYYWVLALVFPTHDGYFSLRIKPKSDLLKKIVPIYKDLNSIDDLNTSTKRLSEFIHEMGFKDYQELMIYILINELKLREIPAMDQGQLIYFSGFENSISEIKRLAFEGMVSFSEAVEIVSHFFRKEILSSSQIQKFSQVFEKLDYLSFNMSIVAHSLGKLGGTLSVISNNFQSTARQVMKQYEVFKRQLDKVQNNLSTAILLVCCLRLKTELLGYFVDEILDQNKNLTHFDHKTFQYEKAKEVNELTLCIGQLSVEAIKLLQSFYLDIVDLKKETKSLLNLIVRLDLIRTGGKLEGSRSQEVVEVFLPFVDEMNQFIETVLGPVEKMLLDVEEMNHSFERITISSQNMSYHLDQLSEVSNQLLLDVKNKKTFLESA